MVKNYHMMKLTTGMNVLVVLKTMKLHMNIQFLVKLLLLQNVLQLENNYLLVFVVQVLNQKFHHQVVTQMLIQMLIVIMKDVLQKLLLQVILNFLYSLLTKLVNQFHHLENTMLKVLFHKYQMLKMVSSIFKMKMKLNSISDFQKMQMVIHTITGHKKLFQVIQLDYMVLSINLVQLLVAFLQCNHLQ